MQNGLGSALADYVQFTHATCRSTRSDLTEPGTELRDHMPAIFTFWHGEHFMVPTVAEPAWNAHALVSRSADGTINAIALEKLGTKVVRGAGETKRGRQGKGHAKGGMTAFRVFARLLEDGASVSLTADVPKVGRKVSRGLVKLARVTKRPIVPIAYVTTPHITLPSWDRASLNLPFTKGGFGASEPIYIDDDGTDEDAWCRRIGHRLDALNAHCYEVAGHKRPQEAARVADDFLVQGDLGRHG